MSQPADTFLDLSGQVAVVTGGGRGLGRAFAEALAAAGAAVAIVARSADQLAETAATISATGRRALSIPTDVSDKQAVREMIGTVERQLGPIDLLINNAGVITPLGPLWETDPDEWWRSLEINVRSVLLCSAAVLPGMTERRRGRIINVASTAGTIGVPFGSAYMTSKTAMIRMSEILAMETAAYGISVFAIHPGNVRTALSEYLMDSPAGQKYTPWFRAIFDEGRDDPIDRSAQLVLYLASGRADALSGCYIEVNDNLDQLVQQASEIKTGGQYTLRVQRAPQ